jgi:hypothetical protein
MGRSRSILCCSRKVTRLVAVVEQEGKTVAATPMTAAMNGTSGPAR